MNEELLDQLLVAAIAAGPDGAHDWEVIHAGLLIKCGSDLPTILDRRIGRGIDPTTGRASRPLRCEWHRRLLKDWMSLDDLISELFMSFWLGARALEPGSGPGYLIQCFQGKLKDALERHRVQDEVVQGDADEQDLEAVAIPDALPLEVRVDIERLAPELASSAVQLLESPMHAGLAIAAGLMAKGRSWRDIASKLQIGTDTLRARRGEWGLLDRSDSMGTTFRQTVIGNWLSRFIPIDIDHRSHIDYAIGIFLAVASDMDNKRPA